MMRRVVQQKLRILATRQWPVLGFAGFGCLSAGAWVAWGVAAGLAAVGASLLFLDYAVGDDE